MILIGCDFHPSWQQVCWLDSETGVTEEAEVVHAPGEVEKSSPAVCSAGVRSAWSRRGIASGSWSWWRSWGTKCGSEDAAKIRASEVRQQKHDRRDAALLLRLLCEKRFPRIWTPSSEERDARQLLIHRHKLVRLRRAGEERTAASGDEPGMQKKRRLSERRGTAGAARASAAAVGRSGGGKIC